MDFELTEEQQMLREAVRDLLTKAYDVESVRKVTDTELGWSPDVWKQLAEMGILGLTIDEENGGAGAGPIEASIVLGELGRSLAPEPYLDAVVLPASILSATGDAAAAELLQGLASGELLIALAHNEPGDRWPSAAVATTATGDGDSITLTGTKAPVLHGDCANKFIVSARSGDAIGLYLVDAEATGLSRSNFRTHDRRRGAQVTFDNTPAVKLAGDAASILADAEITTQTALCAEAVGAMEKSLALTVEYLKTRKQFGVTLSTFEALTHRAADMYVLLELASSLSLYATARLAEGSSDAITASRAKLQICRSARTIGQEAIQMHGGIGMTAEYPVGHYVSRLTAISHTLGGADEHLAKLTQSVRDWDMVSPV
ncbi:putative acyl-CoA dehydrogenase [Gordonia effusa NBRC 100432]|uniref:Putative acyl-CoA dehydrogenase n=1 Tax=Gordonia effusa NBRC 100432 TaxID=1077974 RepID=H0QXM5_9ACTN|nr:acyl-CoA dehydrogenase family protein [Gordonia effusa]GAB17576.1 putative acyl-CoA dehydrogenase [Gordonia effusa NBRC 100432]